MSGSQLGAELASRTMKTSGPGGLQPLRLNGNRVRVDRPAAGSEEEPATVGPIIKGRPRSRSSTSTATRCPRVGRIFVGNFFPFEGYTGGGGKEIIDGLMSSGDVGYFDDDDLLYVSGRDDEMIVSGGENVFPAGSRTHQRPSRRHRGHRTRCGGQRTSGAVAGLRRAEGRCGGHRGHHQEDTVKTSGITWRATRFRAR